MPVTMSLTLGAVTSTIVIAGATPAQAQAMVDAIVKHELGLAPAGMTPQQRVDAFFKRIMRIGWDRARVAERNAKADAQVPDVVPPPPETAP